MEVTLPKEEAKELIAKAKEAGLTIGPLMTFEEYIQTHKCSMCNGVMMHVKKKGFMCVNSNPNHTELIWEAWNDKRNGIHNENYREHLTIILTKEEMN
jgi:hypothetical protein